MIYRKRKILGLLIASVAIVVGLYAAFGSKSAEGLTLTQRIKIKKTEQKIASLFDVPKERPKTAFIVDINKLKQTQPFFSYAENGDLVLKYIDRIVVFRPSTGKIISMGPLQPDAQQTAVPEKEKQTPVVIESITVGSFEVRNGTSVSGLAKKIAGTVTAAYPEMTLKVSGNAAKDTYEKTVVYSKSGAKNTAVDKIAALLKTQVVTVLPTGEKDTAQDILIIVGADQK